MKDRRRNLKAYAEDEPVVKIPSSENWHSKAVEGWGNEVEASLGVAFELFDLNRDGRLDRADHSFILSIAEEVGCHRQAFLFHRFSGGNETFDASAFIEGVQAAWQLQHFNIREFVTALECGPKGRRRPPSRQVVRPSKDKRKEDVEKHKVKASLGRVEVKDGGIEEISRRKGNSEDVGCGEGKHVGMGEVKIAPDSIEEVVEVTVGEARTPPEKKKKMCTLPIPNGIHEMYTVGELIGKGAFAEVFRGKVKGGQGNEEHALKAINCNEMKGLLVYSAYTHPLLVTLTPTLI